MRGVESLQQLLPRYVELKTMLSHIGKKGKRGDPSRISSWSLQCSDHGITQVVTSPTPNRVDGRAADDRRTTAAAPLTGRAANAFPAKIATVVHPVAHTRRKERTQGKDARSERVKVVVEEEARRLTTW